MAKPADIEFLNKMETKARRLARKLQCPDYWAKPFYSDVYTFKRGVPRVFVGVNSKGNRYSLEYDKEQGNGQRIWSGDKPFHNAYLDERWGDTPKRLAAKGQSPLQIAARRVFEAIYGDAWKGKLRNTPCFNLVPVSSNGTKDPVLDEVWHDGVKWGIELIKYLKPKSVILYGNTKPGKNVKSVWAELDSVFSLDDTRTIRQTPPNSRIEVSTFRKEPLKGVPVVGLPHLSMQKGKHLNTLCENLVELMELHKLP